MKLSWGAQGLAEGTLRAAVLSGSVGEPKKTGFRGGIENNIREVTLLSVSVVLHLLNLLNGERQPRS
jgi:hypothetical protein